MSAKTINKTSTKGKKYKNTQHTMIMFEVPVIEKIRQHAQETNQTISSIVNQLVKQSMKF
ncbi:hypothetical protein BXT84_14040 [Sulfobacillus thermotolerans]|uniref:CopG family transcriptional regulator n=1 Tax=Sulfobacillus thermotolerans TaxID=338644 RepID=A0ABM6RU07_9FIRM|nr:hypothetical protein BXT84_14040 [Sulfobacillus thermotolerans]